RRINEETTEALREQRKQINNDLEDVADEIAVIYRPAPFTRATRAALRPGGALHRPPGTPGTPSPPRHRPASRRGGLPWPCRATPSLSFRSRRRSPARALRARASRP